MKRRVVVTGLGAVTPIGNTVEEFWSGIKEGKVGIGEITKFDTTEYKVKIAAEVKDFQAKDRMDFKAARRMEPFSQYAVAAAKEAFEDSGVDMSKEDPFRVGVIVGSGIGSLQAVEKEYETSYTYATLYKDKIYSVEYDIKKEQDNCVNDYESFIKTLKLIDNDLITS